MKSKEHLTPAGLQLIVNLKASVNNGLSDKLKAAFSAVVPVQRPLVVDQQIKDPHWLAGFVDGDGCFRVRSYNSSSQKLRVSLVFKIAQHVRDVALMDSLVKYFDCGSVYNASQDVVAFNVERFSDIHEKIIPTEVFL
jgi:hypothetical protein